MSREPVSGREPCDAGECGDGDGEDAAYDEQLRDESVVQTVAGHTNSSLDTPECVHTSGTITLAGYDASSPAAGGARPAITATATLGTCPDC